VARLHRKGRFGLSNNQSRLPNQCPSERWQRKDAIKLKSKDANVYYRRGGAKQSKGDLDGVIADYTCAIELNPKKDQGDRLGSQQRRGL
jgi:Tetratricopeptide repeat.